MPRLTPEALTGFVRRIFKAAGASDDIARLVSRSLVASNLAGHDSHGVVRVGQYLDSIAAGELDPRATPAVVRETEVMALLDARRGFGQVAARRAMLIAVDKAKAQGLAATTLFNCGHIGRVGEWVQMAADQNLIGLGFCNGGHAGGYVAPYGGAARRLGTNPLAAAIPLQGREPVVLDFATSVRAEGKVRIARNQGRPVPGGWIVNAEGRPTTDPNDLYAGGMLLPAGEYKGYGLSLLVEFLGGVLTGDGCPALPGYRKGNGVLFLALAIDAFRPLDDFLAEGAALAEAVKATPPAPGFDEVLLPGEPETRAARQRRATGIEIDGATWGQLTGAATALGVAIPAPIGGTGSR